MTLLARIMLQTIQIVLAVYIISFFGWSLVRKMCQIRYSTAWDRIVFWEVIWTIGWIGIGVGLWIVAKITVILFV